MVKRWPLHTTLRRAVTMYINIKQQRCMRRSRPTMLFVIILAKILEWPGLVYNTVTGNTGTLPVGGLADCTLTTEEGQGSQSALRRGCGQVCQKDTWHSRPLGLRGRLGNWRPIACRRGQRSWQPQLRKDSTATRRLRPTAAWRMNFCFHGAVMWCMYLPAERPSTRLPDALTATVLSKSVGAHRCSTQLSASGRSCAQLLPAFTARIFRAAELSTNTD